jgi:hypothetical protein
MTTLEEVRARFARDQGLPFADSLSELSIVNALNEHGHNCPAINRTNSTG